MKFQQLILASSTVTEICGSGIPKISTLNKLIIMSVLKNPFPAHSALKFA